MVCPLTEKILKTHLLLLDFVLKEWLLFASAAGLVVTSLYLERVPSYSLDELQFVFLLSVLFVAVRGLERSGLTQWISRILERGRFLSPKLVLVTFVLSMLVTNDVALIIMVPLTLTLDTHRKDMLVILEALSANAGSALTPFGNPQNLFIYWSYGIRPGVFLSEIAPFSVTFLVVLVLASLLLPLKNGGDSAPERTRVRSAAWLYTAFLLVLILAVLRILPVWIAALIIVYAVFFDRKSLKIDFPLLLTFICFFGLAENMKALLPANIEHSGHIFTFSALASQIISNVPATLLFAKFTSQWQALLWGSNVGGFGSLVGSLANLIAYRLYVTHESAHDKVAFTIRFMALGYVAFSLGLGLYFLVQRT